MKRMRLFCSLGTTALVAALALVGGSYLHSGSAHAAAGGMAPGQVPLDTLTHYHLGSGNLPAQQHANGHIDHGLTSIDSLPNFSGKYHADGFDPSGNPNKQWVYNMVGASPEHGGIHQYLVQRRKEIQAALEERIKRGIADGDVPPHANVKAIAAFFMTVKQGLSLRARDGASREAMLQVADAALAAWDALLAKPASPRKRA